MFVVYHKLCQNGQAFVEDNLELPIPHISLESSCGIVMPNVRSDMGCVNRTMFGAVWPNIALLKNFACLAMKCDSCVVPSLVIASSLGHRSTNRSSCREETCSLSALSHQLRRVPLVIVRQVDGHAVNDHVRCLP